MCLAYESNFIGLIKASDILERKIEAKQDLEEIKSLYIDDGYHSILPAMRELDQQKAYSVGMDMDIAIHRPLLITCCKHDSTLRLWNYITRKCEMVKCLTLQHSGGPPEPVKPLSIAFHPSGYMIAGGFDSQTIIWHLLIDDLKQFYVFSHYRHCTKVKFSNGGHSLAIAQMLQTQKFVFVHQTYTLEKLHTIKVPLISTVCDIVFSQDDIYIAVCCTEGTLIVYDTIYHAESMTHSRYKTIYTSCKIIARDEVIAFGADEDRKGIIRKIVRDEIVESVDINMEKITHGIFLNNICFVTGTENGLVVLHDYPFLNKEYSKMSMHTGPISKFKISPNGKYAFTCGEDGVIFMYGIIQKKDAKNAEENNSELAIALSGNESLASVVLIDKAKVEKDKMTINQLREKVKDLETEMIAKERSLNQMWKDNSLELEAEKKREIAELEYRISNLKDEIIKKEEKAEEMLKKAEANNNSAIEDMQAVFKAKIDRERKNYLNLEQKMKEIVENLSNELKKKEIEKEKELIEEHKKYEKDLENLNRKIREVKDNQIRAEKKYDCNVKLQEDEHDKEMDKREIDLNNEINRLNEIMRKRRRNK